VSPGEPLSTPLGSRRDVFPTPELVTASTQFRRGSSLPGGGCPGVCQDLSAALHCSSPHSSLERGCGSLPAQPLPAALPRVSSRNPWPCRVTSQPLLLTLFCSPALTDRFQPGSKSFHSPKPSPSARCDCSAGARAVPGAGRGQDPVCPRSFSLPLGPFSLGKKSFSFFKRKK